MVRQFRGIFPRLAPKLLADNQAQACSNTILKSGQLVPLRANAPVMTLPKPGSIQTIHRFGQDVAADNQYWFHWAADVDVARGFVAGDAQERTYWTGNGAPKVTDSSIALTGGTQYPMASYTLGVPAPASAPVAVVGGSPESATALEEDRVYVVTFVTSWGEEGCPSDASNTVTVQIGETVTLSLPATPSGTYSFASKRIYRSVAGSGSTTFLYVGEVSAAASGYIDAALADALGEELPSLDFQTPPADLQGLTAGPNGVMGAFKGKDLYFCEPFKPHAWPEKYILTVDADIVALAVFDTTWIVLTKSNPYLVQGSHPDGYAMTKAEMAQACVSKRSVVNVDGGVVFASPDGLFLVGGGVARNLTEAILSRREWQALNPSTLHGYVVDNLYVGFYGSATGFLLDMASGDLCLLPWYASAGYYDPIRDALFLVTEGNALVKFDAGANLTQAWRSKPFYSPKPINLGAARVEAESYPVTFKAMATVKDATEAAAIAAARPALSASGAVLTYTVAAADGEAFRLPDGFLANQWEFEVSGAMTISSAGFAESVQELANG